MPSWHRKWKITSSRDSSVEYTVSEGTTKTADSLTTPCYGCSCAAWRFSKKDILTGLRPDCKHIKSVFGKLQLAREEQVNEETRLLLDAWAVEEITVFVAPNRTMEDRC